jgi:hypothetical protein
MVLLDPSSTESTPGLQVGTTPLLTGPLLTGQLRLCLCLCLKSMVDGQSCAMLAPCHTPPQWLQTRGPAPVKKKGAWNNAACIVQGWLSWEGGGACADQDWPAAEPLYVRPK